jgi:fibronectin-binding autotransporter adhesin
VTSSPGTFSAVIAPNSIRFNDTGVAASTAETLTLTGTTNTIASGGILVTSGMGSGLATITGGTLYEGTSSSDLEIIQNNTGAGLTISSIIGNNTATSVTKSGAGLLTLNPASANTFSGTVYLNGGILNTNANGIAGAGGFAFNGGTLQSAAALSTSKGVTMGVNGGTIDTTGGNVTLSGAVVNSAANSVSAGAGAYGGFVATGVGALTVTGSGTLTLSNIANTFGGGIIINRGTVIDGAASGTGAFGSGYVTFGTSNTPTLDLGGSSHAITIAGLIGSSTNGIVTNGTAGAATLTLDGVLSESYGGIIKDGSGTTAVTLNAFNPAAVTTLTGANTYSGATKISAGTLRVNGSSSGAGAVTVYTGATLGGSGTIAGAITVNSGGTIAAGPNATTTGKLISSSSTAVALAGGSAYNWKVNADTSGGTAGMSNGWDLVATQLLALGSSGTNLSSIAPFTVNIQGSPTSGFGAGSQTFQIATAVSGISVNGTAISTTGGNVNLSTAYSGDFVLNTSGFNAPTTVGGSPTWQLEVEADTLGGGGQDLDLVYSATPEPGTAMLVLAGALPMLTSRRRRRNAAR